MSKSAAMKLVVNVQPGELRAGLTRDDQLIDLVIHRDSEEPAPGDLYRGRVRRVVPAMKAAFVDLGNGPDGFLPLKGGVTASEGDYRIVQVRAPARDDKGPVLTAKPNLAGPRVILTTGADGLKPSKAMGKQDRAAALALFEDRPESEDGLILRRSALATGEAALRAEVAHLETLWRDAQERASAGMGPGRLMGAEPLTDLLGTFLAEGGTEGGLICDDGPAAKRLEPLTGLPVQVVRPKSGLFEAEGLEEQLEAALATIVPLPSGGSLILEQTAAVLAVDVNTGGGLSGPDVVRTTNTEAMRALAAQMRLRGLSGHVVVDGLSLEKRPIGSPTLQTLKAALAREDIQADIGGITAQGLLEFTVRRTRASLANLCGPENPTAMAFNLLRQARALAANHPAGGHFHLTAPAPVLDAMRIGQASQFKASIEVTLAVSLVLDEAKPVPNQEVHYER